MERHSTPGVQVALALGALVLHVIVAVAAVMMLVGLAYDFAASVPGGGSVSSRDELYKLGPSPMVAFAVLALLVVLDVPVTGVLLAVARTRPRAWVPPLVGIGLSVVTVVVAAAAFQPPPPDLGG